MCPLSMPGSGGHSMAARVNIALLVNKAKKSKACLPKIMSAM